MKKIIVLIMAAGRGQRMNSDLPKQYLKLHGTSVLRQTIEAFLRIPAALTIQVVIGPDDQKLYEEATEGLNLLPPVIGAEVRQESVRKGLESLIPHEPDYVLIHDGARPFVDEKVINRIVEALESTAGAIPGIPVIDTLKRTSEGLITETVSRESLWRAQTPQGFHFRAILEAHQKLVHQSNFTDDASLFEALNLPVTIVEGCPKNKKITTPEDLSMEMKSVPDVRVGHGLDVHALEAGDGVTILGHFIPCGLRLIGHSDADVGLHSLTDALLGALGEGDIGTHFPSSDPQWKGVDSTVFLDHAVQLVLSRGGVITHVDVTVIGEKPKILTYKDAMRAKLSTILGIDPSRISIKGTTTDKLGFPGRGEGLAAMATATVVF